MHCKKWFQLTQVVLQILHSCYLAIFINLWASSFVLENYNSLNIDSSQMATMIACKSYQKVELFHDSTITWGWVESGIMKTSSTVRMFFMLQVL